MPVDGRVAGEWPYVIAAYAVTWVVLIGYAIHLYRVWTQASRDAERSGL
ncbi:MAG: hypothetical protein SFW08_01395 [Gemmatimonadaceae bacterium]|nr:hypothetical protein [Gemmatimonadaceae bacterium]